MRRSGSRFIVLKTAVLLAVCICLAGCGTGEEADGPSPLHVRLDEVMTIGLETTEDDLLSGPQDVAVSNDGRVFVADRMESTIRVFDPDGHWLYDIGERGEGPGELGGFHQIEITSDQRILVHDTGNWRLTQYSLEGDHLETMDIPVGEPEWVTPFSIQHWKERDYLMVGAKSGEEPTQTASDHVLHHVRLSEQQEVLQSMLSVEEDLGRTGDFEARLVESQSLLLQDGALLYAPSGYAGRLAHLRYDEDTATWVMSTPWEGHIPVDEPWRELDPDDYDMKQFDPDDPESPNVSGIEIVDGEVYQYAGMIYSRSMGLFELEDGGVLHFSEAMNDEEYMVAIELFSSEGRLLGQGYLPGEELSPAMRVLNIADSGDSGRYYLLARTTDGAPIVHVVKMEYELVEE